MIDPVASSTLQGEFGLESNRFERPRIYPADRERRRDERYAMAPVARGRLSLSMDVTPWLAAIEDVDAISFVPVDRKIAVVAVELPGQFHKDPADRIIVATERKLGLPIVTADEKIGRYPHVRTIL
jgi:predicted nucleic acid-binding protein